jgi:hypothetical protein
MCLHVCGNVYTRVVVCDELMVPPPHPFFHCVCVPLQDIQVSAADPEYLEYVVTSQGR